MAKKIIVSTYANDSSQTPDEGQKIEVRVVQELPPEPRTSEPEVDAPATESASEPVGAPPLNKKLAKKIIIGDEDQKAAAPTAAPLTVEALKKYRPPDGPLPFKRAPTEMPSQDAAASLRSPLPANNMAQPSPGYQNRAADGGPPTRARTAPKSSSRKLLAIVAVVIIIVGLAAAVIAVPSVRQRLTGKKTPTVSQTSTTSRATQPAVTPPAAVPIPDIFLARKDAIYNLYKIDQNGQNQQQLLAGSGNETSPTTQLLANPEATVAALVSIRDKTKDATGYPLQVLTLVDTATSTATPITQAQRLQLLGWYGTRLVFVASKTGPTAGTDTNSDRLIAYDTASKRSQVLDHAAHFNAVRATNNGIYYAPDGLTAALYQINPDGSAKRTVLRAQVAAVYRKDYTTLAITTGTSWYTLDISTTNAQPVGTINAYTGSNRLYIDAPDHRHSLYVATQAGVPTLLLYDVATKKEVVLSQKAGLGYPVHWLSNSLAVYRIDSASETADYTIDVSASSSSKLVDTSAFLGLQP